MKTHPVICLLFSALCLLSATANSSATPAAGLKLSDIEYAVASGESLKLDIDIPAGPGPFPAVIYVHGGGWTKGDKTIEGASLFEPLEKAGIARFSINYRLAPAHKYPASSDDVDTAIRWVKSHAADYNIDPARLVLMGDSAGGHLVALATTRAADDATTTTTTDATTTTTDATATTDATTTDETLARQRPIQNRVPSEARSLASKIENPTTRVAATVVFYGPTDMEKFFLRDAAALPAGHKSPGEAYMGVTADTPEARQLLREASPIDHVRPGLPPFLLLHGDKDPLVPIAQTVAFEQKLRAAGVPCEFIIVKGGMHGMKKWDALNSDYVAQVIAWLQKTLNSKTAIGI